MDGWLGFNGMQHASSGYIMPKFISKANGVYKEIMRL